MKNPAWEKAPAARRAPRHFQEGPLGAKGRLELPGLSLGDMGRKTYTLLSCHTRPSLCVHHLVPWDSGKFHYLHPFFPLQARPRPFQAEENHSLGELDSTPGTP